MDDHAVSLLVAAAIILDTGNFCDKLKTKTPKDLKVFNHVSSVLGLESVRFLMLLQIIVSVKF